MKIPFSTLLISGMLFLNPSIHPTSPFSKIDSPGYYYLLFDTKEIWEEKISGYANLITGKNVDANTRFRIYSITKTFTSLAILQLYQEGKIHLDDSVSSYIPEFSFSEPLSIRHLLSHGAGIKNPIPLNWIHTPEEHPSFNSDSFFADILASNSKLEFNPGDRYSYSNLGYFLLGMIIERISNCSYEEYITSHIISKLNCSTIGFEPSQEIDAIGYQKRWSLMNFALGFMINRDQFMEAPQGNWIPFRPLIPNGAAYSGALSDAQSLMNYTRLIMEGEELLSDSLKDLWFSPVNFKQRNQQSMSLGWFVDEMNGIRYVTHAGGGGGFYSEIRIYPELKIGSLILTNQTGVSDKRILSQLDAPFISNFTNTNSKKFITE